MTGTLAQNVMSLSKSEQEQLFGLLNNHANLLNKVIPHIPLLEYIAAGVIVDTATDPMVQAFNAWKNKNN